MTYPHPEEPPKKRESAKCGGCKFVGFGPGMAVICRHPERHCWLSLGDWVVGCKEFVEWPGIGVGPEPVKMSDYCCELAEERYAAVVAQRMRLARRAA